MKQKFYNIKDILKQNCEYNIILGERSNGKSYQGKIVCLYEAWTGLDFITKQKKTRSNFGYLRRWREEIKSRDCVQYFDDLIPYIRELTNNEADSIICFRNDLYFAQTLENGYQVKVKKCGSCFALTSATHYKSLSFSDIGNIIFEEFITKYGYLNKETETLMDIVSTIARRDSIRVLLIGNTIDRMCPYFRDWDLKHIKTQKQGTIDIYRQSTTQTNDDGKPVIISIAVEYCENSGNNSKMFFGQSAKMITSGVWESDVYPHLKGKLSDYKCYYTLIYNYLDFSFIIKLLIDKDKNPFLYVYPNTKPDRNDIKRIVQEDYKPDIFTTNFLTIVTKYDKLIIDLINNKKVVFSDNLTGTEFNKIKVERGKF
jgi:hypothetical protein